MKRINTFAIVLLVALSGCGGSDDPVQVEAGPALNVPSPAAPPHDISNLDQNGCHKDPVTGEWHCHKKG